MTRLTTEERKLVKGGWTYSKTCSQCGFTFSQSYYEFITYFLAKTAAMEAIAMHEATHRNWK